MMGTPVVVRRYYYVGIIGSPWHKQNINRTKVTLSTFWMILCIVDQPLSTMMLGSMYVNTAEENAFFNDWQEKTINNKRMFRTPG